MAVDRVSITEEAGAAATSMSSHDDLVVRLRLAIGRLHRRLRVDAGASLPPLQTATLATLEGRGPLRAHELAHLEAVTPPTMSRVVASLAQAGLLVRAGDPGDARSVLIGISPRGRDRLATVRHERARLLADRLEGLAPEQRRALARALPALEELAVAE